MFHDSCNHFNDIVMDSMERIMATSAQTKTFINYIAPMIQAEAKARGYKVCSTIIAQAVIEGASGTSSLAKYYHNHFGMKCGKSWKGASVNLKTKEEYSVGQLTTIKDNFRVYSSDAQGVAGYFEFISASRYANLKDATTYTEYAQMLKDDGYATSSTYVQTLCNTVTRYDLTKWDDFGVKPINARPILKKGVNGDDVAYCQRILIGLGYDLGKWGADGQFGAQTDLMVRRFQSEHGLKVDGIVGVKTWAMLEKYD